MAENNRIDPAFPYIDGKVKALKATMTKLRHRVENLELSGLQEQITSLDSRVKQLDSSLLELERGVAQLYISHYLLWASWIFGGMTQSTNVQSCVRFARELCASAKAEVISSNEPHKIYSNWYSRCSEYFKKHGFPDVFP